MGRLSFSRLRLPAGGGPGGPPRRPWLPRAIWWVEERPLALSLAAFLATAGVSAAMALAAGWHSVERVLDRAHPGWLGLLVCGQALSYASYALAHRLALTAGGRRHLTHETAISMAAYGAAATSLRGGFSIDRRVLQGAGASRRRANVRVLGLGALEYAVLAPVTCVCAITLLGDAHVQRAVTVPWVVGVPLGAAAALWLAYHVRARERRPRGTLGRVLEEAIAALELVGEQLRHPLRHGAAWTAMAAHWAAELLSLWAALRVFALNPSLSVLLVGYATGYALTPRSLPLAGSGVTEALLPLSLNWVGLPLAVAVPAVFAYRMTRLGLSTPPAFFARERVRELLERAYAKA